MSIKKVHQCLNALGLVASRRTQAMSTALPPKGFSSLQCWRVSGPAWRHPQRMILESSEDAGKKPHGKPRSSVFHYILLTAPIRPHRTRIVHRDGDTGLPASERGDLLLPGGLVSARLHPQFLIRSSCSERPAYTYTHKINTPQ